jgi:CRISPR-associated protein Cas1
MATLYITEQGAKLTRESHRLLVIRGDEVLLDVPVIKVERVLIFGYAQITTQALELLLNEGVSTSFLSMDGRLKGTLEAIGSKNIPLRMKQYERSRDPEFCLSLAKRIVTGKIRNQKRLVQRFAHNRPAEDFAVALRDMDIMLGAVERRTAIGGLMGVEGRATAVYFEAYGRMFNQESRFEKRSRRPPRDPVNSLLSLGYTLLSNEYFSAVAAVGLDPYLGFFHQIDYGRPSLALDLVEELRHPLVDMLTLDVFNRKILQTSDFCQQAGGFYLTSDARKKYLAKYERRMTIKFKHPRRGENTTVRSIIREQVLEMARAIKSEKDYESFFIG